MYFRCLLLSLATLYLEAASVVLLPSAHTKDPLASSKDIYPSSSPRHSDTPEEDEPLDLETLIQTVDENQPRILPLEVTNYIYQAHPRKKVDKKTVQIIYNLLYPQWNRWNSSAKIACPTTYERVGQTCLSLTCPMGSCGWKEARLYCRVIKGGDLAVFNSDEEMAAAIHFLRKTDKNRQCSYWIGGSDIDSEDDWKWNNGKIMPYGSPPWGQNKGKVEPGGGTYENFAMLYSKDNYLIHDIGSEEARNIRVVPLCQVVNSEYNGNDGKTAELLSQDYSQASIPYKDFIDILLNEPKQNHSHISLNTASTRMDSAHFKSVNPNFISDKNLQQENWNLNSNLTNGVPISSRLKLPHLGNRLRAQNIYAFPSLPSYGRPKKRGHSYYNNYKPISTGIGDNNKEYSLYNVYQPANYPPNVYQSNNGNPINSNYFGTYIGPKPCYNCQSPYADQYNYSNGNYQNNNYGPTYTSVGNNYQISSTYAGQYSYNNGNYQNNNYSPTVSNQGNNYETYSNNFGNHKRHEPCSKCQPLYAAQYDYKKGDNPNYKLKSSSTNGGYSYKPYSNNLGHYAGPRPCSNCHSSYAGQYGYDNGNNQNNNLKSSSTNGGNSYKLFSNNLGNYDGPKPCSNCHSSYAGQYGYANGNNNYNIPYSNAGSKFKGFNKYHENKPSYGHSSSNYGGQLSNKGVYNEKNPEGNIPQGSIPTSGLSDVIEAFHQYTFDDGSSQNSNEDGNTEYNPPMNNNNNSDNNNNTENQYNKYANNEGYSDNWKGQGNENKGPSDDGNSRDKEANKRHTDDGNSHNRQHSDEGYSENGNGHNDKYNEGYSDKGNSHYKQHNNKGYSEDGNGHNNKYNEGYSDDGNGHNQYNTKGYSEYGNDENENYNTDNKGYSKNGNMFYTSHHQHTGDHEYNPNNNYHKNKGSYYSYNTKGNHDNDYKEPSYESNNGAKLKKCYYNHDATDDIIDIISGFHDYNSGKGTMHNKGYYGGTSQYESIKSYYQGKPCIKCNPNKSDYHDNNKGIPHHPSYHPTSSESIDNDNGHYQNVYNKGNYHHNDHKHGNNENYKGDDHHFHNNNNKGNYHHNDHKHGSNENNKGDVDQNNIRPTSSELFDIISDYHEYFSSNKGSSYSGYNENNYHLKPHVDQHYIYDSTLNCVAHKPHYGQNGEDDGHNHLYHQIFHNRYGVPYWGRHLESHVHIFGEIPFCRDRLIESHKGYRPTKGDKNDYSISKKAGNYIPLNKGENHEKYAPTYKGENHEQYTPKHKGENHEQYAPTNKGENHEPNAPTYKGESHEQYAPTNKGENYEQYAPTHKGENHEQYDPTRKGYNQRGSNDHRNKKGGHSNINFHLHHLNHPHSNHRQQQIKILNNMLNRQKGGIWQSELLNRKGLSRTPYQTFYGLGALIKTPNQNYKLGPQGLLSDIVHHEDIYKSNNPYLNINKDPHAVYSSNVAKILSKFTEFVENEDRQKQINDHVFGQDQFLGRKNSFDEGNMNQSFRVQPNLPKSESNDYSDSILSKKKVTAENENKKLSPIIVTVEDGTLVDEEKSTTLVTKENNSLEKLTSNESYHQNVNASTITKPSRQSFTSDETSSNQKLEISGAGIKESAIPYDKTYDYESGSYTKTSQ